jgi:hypothetical protein
MGDHLLGKKGSERDRKQVQSGRGVEVRGQGVSGQHQYDVEVKEWGSRVY